MTVLVESCFGAVSTLAADRQLPAINCQCGRVRFYTAFTPLPPTFTPFLPPFPYCCTARRPCDGSLPARRIRPQLTRTCAGPGGT